MGDLTHDRELQLVVTIRTPSGTSVGALKYDEREQTYELLQNGDYLVRFTKSPKYEFVIPRANVRCERRVAREQKK